MILAQFRRLAKPREPPDVTRPPRSGIDWELLAPRFSRGDAYRQTLIAPKQREPDRVADPPAGEKPVQVVDTGHAVVSESNDDVSFAHSRSGRRRILFHGA